jgi:hypothetical protein
LLVFRESIDLVFKIRPQTDLARSNWCTLGKIEEGSMHYGPTSFDHPSLRKLKEEYGPQILFNMVFGVDIRSQRSGSRYGGNCSNVSANESWGAKTSRGPDSNILVPAVRVY